MRSPRATRTADPARAFESESGAGLSCKPITAPSAELDGEGAPGVLRSSQAQGLGPATVSRGLMFAHEVGRELDREQQRRCAPGGLRRTVN